jgi:hypothetical protein
MDEDRALALPTEAGGGRDGLLEHRSRVDVGLLLSPEGLHHDAEFLEAGQDHVVVIGAERVFGDAVACRRVRLEIVQPHHDQAAGLGEDPAGVGAALRVARQPGHIAVHAVGDPLPEVIGPDVDLDGRDPEGVEAQRLRRGFDPLAEGARFHPAQPRIDSTRPTISSTGASLPTPS